MSEPESEAPLGTVATAPVTAAELAAAGSAGRADASELFVGLRPPTPSPDESTRVVGVSITTEPDALEVEAGQTGSIEFQVRNTGTVVDQISIAFEGPGELWATATPHVVNLYPGDTLKGTITLAPPRVPESAAGSMKIVVRATSGEDPAMSASAQLVVTVLPFYEMTGRLTPHESMGRRYANHEVTITNASNVSVEPSLGMTDENDALEARIQPSQARIQPGKTRSFNARVRVKRLKWVGSAVVHPFEIVAEESDALRVTPDGRITQRPVVPAWAVKVAALVVPLVAVLVAFLLLWTPLPDVEGRNQVHAVRELKAAGFEVEVYHERSDDIRARRVVRTEPEAGTRLRGGTLVKLFVSAGKTPVIVPNVLGLDAKSAYQELVALGLVVKQTKRASSDVDAGLAITTDPLANELVPPRATVTLVLSTGVNATATPLDERGNKAGGGGGGGGDNEGDGDPAPASGDETPAEADESSGGAGDDAPTPPYWPASVATNDFDGDGAGDFAVFRPRAASWLVRFSGTGDRTVVAWHRHRGTDIPVPGDYDGDARADFATWRPANGTWYVRSAPGADEIAPFGKDGDIPAPADYDGDGTTDLAVFDRHEGRWRVRPSGGGDVPLPDEPFGSDALGDVPVPGDYDGDGDDEVAFYRSTTGDWHIWYSSSRQTTVAWGDPDQGDFPVPGDYDGDGTFDLAVWDPKEGVWKIKPVSGDGYDVSWGDRSLKDAPVPGDYTGDGRFDFAVWRESNGEWRVKPRERQIRVQTLGTAGDVPL